MARFNVVQALIIGAVSCAAADFLWTEKDLLQGGYTAPAELNVFQETSVFRKTYNGGSNTVVMPKEFKPHQHVMDLFRAMEGRQAAAAPFLETMGVSPADYVHWIPEYLTSLVPNSANSVASWNRSCYLNNTASITFDGKTAVLSFNTTHKTSKDCDDGYFIATTSRADIHYMADGETHRIEWRGPFTPDQVADIQANGIRIFILPDGATQTIVDVWEALQLFVGALIQHNVPDFTAEDNLVFLRDYANYTLEPRTTTEVTIDPKTINSGDFLGIIRLDGLDPMLAWGMGAHTGHTAITMWINGSLYVCESTTNSKYWPTNGLQKTPWEQWLKQATAASYNVVHLPLSPANAAKFNVDAALAWFDKWEGYPYGFQNMLFSWLDTPDQNFPPPVTWQAAAILFGLLDDLIPANATYSLFAQALNQRLGTQGLTVREAYALGASRNLSFTDLIVIPEQDDWLYYDRSMNRMGPSRMCDALVTTLWIQGGLFDVDFQATEFTNFDAYSLNIFDSNYVRPPQCVAADPDSQFCQLRGKYRMNLPGYNTYTPFTNMREHCPSLPPSYTRPANC